MKPKKQRSTLMQELHDQFEARILANDGVIWPLSQSIDPTPEQIEAVRKKRLDAEAKRKVNGEA